MKKIFLTLLSVTVLGVSVFADEISTAYFLDNNVYSYRLNPAIAGERNFVGLGISNFNVGGGSNIGVNSLIFKNPSGSGFVTGFNSAISSDEFLGKLKANNRIYESFDENILAVGFWAGKSFHSIELNLRESSSSIIPKDLFDVLKNGDRDTPFDITGMGVSAVAYAELAYGYSRRITDNISVGGRAKFLLGLARADAAFSDSYLTLSGGVMGYDVNADLMIAGNFVNVGTKQSEWDPDKTVLDLSNVQFAGIKPSGFGGAVDLGVTWEPVKDLVLSFSVLDLGGIGWRYNVVGKSDGEDKINGFSVSLDNAESEIQQELDEVLKNLQRLIDFRAVDGFTSFKMLPTSINLGARYYMPFYDRLSVGALASYKFEKYNPYFDFRAGATLTPIDWFSLTGSFGVNAYCTSFGAAASFNLGPFNFFAGFESYCGKCGAVNTGSSSFTVPLGSFYEIAKLGLNITFGERHTQFSTRSKGFKNLPKE